MSNNLIEGQYYKCDSNDHIFLYKYGKFNQILDKNVYNLLGAPEYITINCNIVSQNNTGEIITETNYKFFLNTTKQEVLNGVDKFLPGNYYICQNVLFFIESNRTKRLVTDLKEIHDNRPDAIMANCERLNELPYYYDNKLDKYPFYISLGVIALLLIIIIILIIMLIIK